MRNFKSNFRRNRFRSNGDRNYHKNDNLQKNHQELSNGLTFKRKNHNNRNNINAPKLVEKYKNLAREALSIGDKILSENYLQHADHFIRLSIEKEISRNNNIVDSSSEKEVVKDNSPKKDQSDNIKN
tara:strand:- start:165 stop:545 length:381 start_codon:yes stop_codon:yes gene_type:complete